jgi:hypothetical protein
MIGEAALPESGPVNPSEILVIRNFRYDANDKQKMHSELDKRNII